MALFNIKQRSRQRLETVYTTHRDSVVVLVIGVLLLLFSLLTTHKGIFECQKYSGAPGLNDVCSLTETSLAANIPIINLLTPASIQFTKQVFPFQYIKNATVVQTEHYDSETSTTTYTYEPMLLINVLKLAQDKEKLQQFYNRDNYNNLHDILYTQLPQITESLSELQKAPVYRYSIGPDSSSLSDAERLVMKIRALLHQYNFNSQQPLSYKVEDVSYICDILLSVALLLIGLALFFTVCEEWVVLDYTTKMMIVTTKTLLGSTRDTHMLTINQIESIAVDEKFTRRHRSNSRHGFQQTRVEKSVGALLKYTDHHNVSTLQMADHRARQVRTYQAPAATESTTTTTTENNNNNNNVNNNNSSGENDPLLHSAQTETPQEARENALNYAAEPGEDGELVLLPRARTPQQQQQNTSQSQTTSSTTTIQLRLLCGKWFEEARLQDVREYVNLFNDWIAEFHNRQNVAASTRAAIIQRAAAVQSAAANVTPLEESEVTTLLQKRPLQFFRPPLPHDHEVEDETATLPSLPHDEATDGEEVPTVESPVQTPTAGATPANSSGNKLNEPRVCCVCFDDTQPVRTVLIPCNHLILCDQCAAAVDNCPACRKPIDYTIKVFF